MRSSAKWIIAVTIGAAAAIALCACDEYSQAKKNFTGEVNGLLSEANDLKSDFNAANDEFSQAVSDLQGGFTGQSGSSETTQQTS